MPIIIKPVTTKREMKQFICFNYELYKDSAYAVPDLYNDVRDTLDPKKNAAFETLFEYFSHWKTTTIARLLRALYVFLWSLLFIIPGIVAGFSYAMTDYILAETPELTADEAITQSKTMMYGNRFRFFCLQFSFIGWGILATLAFGIGHLWLTPYKQAAYAAFYREVSGTEYYEDGFETVIE